MAETLTVQMDRILEEYSKRVQNVTNVAIDRVARESVRRLRSTSPRGKHHLRGYAEGWGLKNIKMSGNIADVVVYNKTNWQLTHLLENSHLIRNAKGEYGRTYPGHGQVIHIKKVAEWANVELPERIERELK